jgi:predicted aspartyl protease
MEKLAELPVSVQHLKALVAAKINGVDVQLIADTGATMGGFTAASAAQLGVAGRPLAKSIQVRGMGGAPGDFSLGTVKDLSLAGRVFHNVDFLIGGRIADVGASGRLGQNLMGAVDTEYDLGAQAIRLFSAQTCADESLVYWRGDQPFSVIALDGGPPTRQIKGFAKIDGVVMHVMFDSGAPYTMLSRAAAIRAGIDLTAAASSSGGAVRSAVSGGPIAVVVADVKSFTLGGEQVENAKLRVADTLGDDMVVGMDFFLAHRMIVDRDHDRLYFTTNHGQMLQTVERTRPH